MANIIAPAAAGVNLVGLRRPGQWPLAHKRRQACNVMQRYATFAAHFYLSIALSRPELNSLLYSMRPELSHYIKDVYMDEQDIQDDVVRLISCPSC